MYSKLRELKALIRGNLLLKDADRMLYSTDASIYQQLPLAIVTPRDREDCLHILKFARENKLALIPRAGGTSLAGQVVGEALVVDVSRYLTKIIEVDPEQQTALVEPGVIIESLNSRIKSLGLKFAPDPSTLNRCTVAGVMGNNAWGAHAPVYGSTRDHIVEAELALLSGDLVQTQPLDKNGLNEKLRLTNKEGEIYRCIHAILKQHKALIIERYPDKHQLICNAGYALHELVEMIPHNPRGSPFNLSALLCGSEGTLGLITKARVKLVPLPKHSVIIGAHYHHLDDALHSVGIALKHQAAAVELLDDYLLRLTKQNPEQTHNRFWISGDPAAVLLIELYGNSPGELAERAQHLIGEFRSQSLGYTYSIVEGDKIQQVWSMRRAALGLLMGLPGHRKAASFIEDSAVAVTHLPQFVRQVRSLMEQTATPCVYYGSVSMGLIHIRPLLDLHNSRDRQTMIMLANEVASLLKQYHGTMSAKHGDGIVRSPYIETFFGNTIVQSLHEIKKCFDPDELLNPHKIIHPGPIDRHLRYQPTALSNRAMGFDWGAGGIAAAAEQCNGAAACRKLAGTGTMCPSYMATLDEQHSTRGRANTFRQVLQQNVEFTTQSLNLLKDSLKYCLSCKACHSECPANVDMAKLKAEFLFQYHKKNGVSKRVKLLSLLDSLSLMGSRAPALSNAIFKLPLTKRAMGFTPNRPLPVITNTRFSRWFATHIPHANAGNTGSILILNELFSEYYDDSLGRSVVELLERWGYKVSLSPCFASPRLSISLGLLNQASARLNAVLDWLGKYSTEHSYIIGLEPSELLTYRDEAKSLLSQVSAIDTLEKLQLKMLLFEEFVCQNKSMFAAKTKFNNEASHVALHIHCHQKALSGAGKCMDALGIIPRIELEVIPSGCCGMAGYFGYEKQNFDLSAQIAELILLPFIRKLPSTTKIVATGASCRQQISHFLKIKAWHPAQIIRQQLAD